MNSQSDIFDPESVFEKSSEEDSDEGQYFRSKVLDANPVGSNCSVEDMVGLKVVAHKGKIVPCWFPGIVKSKCAKGYEVEFYSNLGVHVCTRKNIMSYEEFKGKNKTTALFKVPASLHTKFNHAISCMELDG